MESKEELKNKEVYRKNWPNGSITRVTPYDMDKKPQMYANMYKIETEFEVKINSSVAYERLLSLNHQELKGVFIYDEEKSIVTFRSVNHYKPNVFTEPKIQDFILHMEKSKAHRFAKNRFLDL